MKFPKVMYVVEHAGDFYADPHFDNLDPWDNEETVHPLAIYELKFVRKLDTKPTLKD